MPTPLGEAAIGIGTGLIDTAINLGLDNERRRRDVKQQKQLMDYQQMKQLEMWEKTGYGAQMKQLSKAGLNPGLLYGMSGGGAQTIGGGIPGASSQQLSTNAGGMGIQAAAQLGLMKAQKENIEADTASKKVDAAKKAGVDTAEAQSRTDLNKIKLQWDKIELEIKDRSKEDAIRKIWYEADEMAYKANLAEADSAVQTSEETIQQRKQEIAARAATAIIQKELAELGKTKTQAEIEKIKQDVQNSLKELQLKGTAINNDTIRTTFETNIGNRLSIEAVKALGGLANMYIGRKTVDVNK